MSSHFIGKAEDNLKLSKILKMNKVLSWWNKAAENKILNFETLKLCTTASKRIISEKWKYTMVVIE